MQKQKKNSRQFQKNSKKKRINEYKEPEYTCCNLLCSSTTD